MSGGWGTDGWGQFAWGGRGLEAAVVSNIAVLTGFTVEYRRGSFVLASVAPTFTLIGFLVVYQSGTLVQGGEYQWTAGTVDLIDGTTTVNGIGTDWIGNISAGDIFIAFFSDDVRSSVPYEIASVTNSGLLTLTAPWRGPSISGVPYLIHRSF